MEVKNQQFSRDQDFQDAWIQTLNGIEALWKDLRDNYHFEFLILRRLNQDALENFFAQIRLCGQWSDNPTVPQFISALKTALVDLLTKMNIRGANCEIDDLTFLASLNALVDSDAKSSKRDETSDYEFVDTFDYSTIIHREQSNGDDPTESETLADQSLVYVSGYLARHMLKHSGCSTCRQSIRTDIADESHLFMQLKGRVR